MSSGPTKRKSQEFAPEGGQRPLSTCNKVNRKFKADTTFTQDKQCVTVPLPSTTIHYSPRITTTTHTPNKVVVKKLDPNFYSLFSSFPSTSHKNSFGSGPLRLNPPLPTNAAEGASKDNSIDLAIASSSDAKENKPLTFNVINARKATQLLSAQYLNFLFIDCRDSQVFQKNHIKYSINVPTDGHSVRFSFNFQKDVINYLFMLNCTLIGHLNEPGYYTSVVVYDQDSTRDNIPNPVRNLLDALVKWNAGTETKISFLDGGVQKFSGYYSYGMFKSDEVEQIKGDRIFWSYPATLEKFQDHETFRLNALQQNFQRLSLTKDCDMIKEYISTLSSITCKTWYMIICKKQLKSLQAIKDVLSGEVLQDFNQIAAMIPNDVRCPVCGDIYSSGIYQCAKGHCLCHRCSLISNLCQECGSPSDWIRNIALERMIKLAFKMDCPFGCNEKLSCHQIKAHLDACSNKLVAKEEMTNIENEIVFIKNVLNKLRCRVDSLSGRILQMESSWDIEGENFPHVMDQLKDAAISHIDELQTAKMTWSQEILYYKPVTPKIDMFI